MMVAAALMCEGEGECGRHEPHASSQKELLDLNQVGMSPAQRQTRITGGPQMLRGRLGKLPTVASMVQPVLMRGGSG